jgi:hypothetical protein
VAPEATPNALEGRVHEAIFAGSDTRLVIQLGSMGRVLAKLANDRSLHRLHHGQPVWVSWRTEDALGFVDRQNG